MANIFVIDDDAQLLQMVGLMLKRGGHTATLINSPFEGLEKLKESKPDMLILDVMMPVGMSLPGKYEQRMIWLICPF